MRFVAVVLSDDADSTPRTHQYICNHVAGLAGPGIPHALVGESLAAMLQIGAVQRNRREFELAPDWPVKLQAFADATNRPT
jgi:hypothetical protein